VYTPSSFAENRPEVIFDFIEAHSLGALITSSASGELFASHLPWLVDRARGEHGTLRGHLARANPHHRLPRAGGDDGEALVIFNGHDAYIRPGWYASKTEHGRVVPTWDYVAVHAYGTLRFIDDPAILRELVESLTARHEMARPQPWHVSDAPEDYVRQQLKAIVGVELTITRLEGKWKMSQNRPGADIDGVVRGLGESPVASDRAVADIVAARRPPRT
jgi:transcriptional regulator